MSWTDERVELLRKLWTDGLSASQVAAELGPGITRNAVIGKIHRLGLAERAKTASAQRPRVAKAPRPTHPRMNGVSSHGNLALAFAPH
ncbi:MAG: GcrA family cell cycle regulator, partial [Rhodoplanes sp.]